jgi:membrane-bound lytic murein transglycosylase B
MKVAAGVVSFVVLLALAMVTVVGQQTPSSSSQLAPMSATFRSLYIAAAATCPGLPAEILMAIGDVESGHGANDGPSSAGAAGPMQFEPATFAEYALPVPPGGANPPTPWDPVDAVYAAARDLCANGARGGADIPGAIFAYNHDNTYVADVLAVAAIYTAQDTVTATGTVQVSSTVGGGA